MSSQTGLPADLQPTVLVIDDDERIRRLLALTLKGGPFRLIQEADAIAGLARARDERPALILLDIRLGREDGLRVCSALKSNPATAGVPIYILSALGDPVTREKARRAGADGFFAKPFRPLALWRAIDQRLGIGA